MSKTEISAKASVKIGRNSSAESFGQPTETPKRQKRRF